MPTALTKALTDSNSSNWKDTVKELLAFIKPLSDSESANWSEVTSANFSFLKTVVDSFSVSDAIVSEIGLALKDTLGSNWIEIIGLGLEADLALSDLILLADQESQQALSSDLTQVVMDRVYFLDTCLTEFQWPNSIGLTLTDSMGLQDSVDLGTDRWCSIAWMAGGLAITQGEITLS